MVRKFAFLKHSFFQNILLLSISINFFQTSSSDNLVGGNFACLNSIILVEDLLRNKNVLYVTDSISIIS